jgi:hypothetical protein
VNPNVSNVANLVIYLTLQKKCGIIIKTLTHPHMNQKNNTTNKKASKNFLILSILTFVILVTIGGTIAFNFSQTGNESQAATTSRNAPRVPRPTRNTITTTTSNTPNNNSTTCVVTGNNQTCVNGKVTQR